MDDIACQPNLMSPCKHVLPMVRHIPPLPPLGPYHARLGCMSATSLGSPHHSQLCTCRSPTFSHLFSRSFVTCVFVVLFFRQEGWDPSDFQIQSLTCCDLSIFFIIFEVCSLISSKMFGNFLKSWALTGYFSKSTNSFITSSWFSLFIDHHHHHHHILCYV